MTTTYPNTSKAQPIGQKLLVFDTLSQSYLPVEYEVNTRQWYFIRQDTRTRNWIATQPVPSTFNLGRQSIKQSTIQAADVDDSEGQSNHPTDHQHHSMAMTTQTQTSTAAAALTLAGTQAPTSTPIIWGFRGKPCVDKGKGSRNPPGGGGGSGSPPGGGLPGGGFPGGGAPGPGGGNTKLGGNPPPEFNGDRSQASTFMNQFNLYHLANMEVDQMRVPMKRAALLLGFIKGPNVDAWVKLCTDEILRRFN